MNSSNRIHARRQWLPRFVGRRRFNARPRRVYLAALWWCVAYGLNASYLLERLARPDASEPVATLPSPTVPQAAFILFLWELVALVRMRTRAVEILVVLLLGWSWMMAIQLALALWTHSWALIGGWAALFLVVTNLVVVTLVCQRSFRARCLAAEKGPLWNWRPRRRALG